MKLSLILKNIIFSMIIILSVFNAYSLYTGSIPDVTTGNTIYATDINRIRDYTVPQGAVMAFNLASCPPGWTEYTSARGRTLIGTNPNTGNGLSISALNATLGAESVTLTSAQSGLPAHTHIFSGAGGTTAVESNGHTHTVSGTTGVNSVNHTHATLTDTTLYALDTTGANGLTDNGDAGGIGVSVGNTTALSTQTTGGQSANHTHTFSDVSTDVSATHTHTFTPAGTNANNTATNASSAHSVMQPSIALLYCSKN